MPSAFPETEFRAFGIAAGAFFPDLMSDENLYDPLEKRRHFEWSWQAVRYRYRICAECNDEFKSLLANASEAWRSGWGDEEMNYKLERCIYVFFMSGLSVLESFCFCLYFLGSAMRPTDFPHFNKPRKISLNSTSEAFSAAFPQEAITGELEALSQKPEFIAIDGLRNVLAHRVSGRRSIRAWGTVERDGTHTHTQEETWHVPGSAEKLVFDETMIERHLSDITTLLTTLASASRAFAENNQHTKVQP